MSKITLIAKLIEDIEGDIDAWSMFELNLKAGNMTIRELIMKRKIRKIKKMLGEM